MEELDEDDEVGRSHAISRADWAPGQTRPREKLPPPRRAQTCDECQREWTSTGPAEETHNRCEQCTHEAEQFETWNQQTVSRQWWQAATIEHQAEATTSAAVVPQLAAIMLMAQANFTPRAESPHTASDKTWSVPARFDATPEHHIMFTEPTETGLAPLSITARISNSQMTKHKLTKVYYDSCAGASTVSLRFATRHGLSIEPGNGGRQESINFAGFTDGTRTSAHTTVVEVNTGNTKLQYRCWVVEDAPVELLIGRDQMKADEGKGVTLRPDPTLGKGSVQFTSTGESVPADSTGRANRRAQVTLLQETIADPSARAMLAIRTTTPQHGAMGGSHDRGRMGVSGAVDTNRR